MALEIFNTNYKLLDVLAPLSQEEILHTPEFYAMPLETILKSGSCPGHLHDVLTSMASIGWGGKRQMVVQVRCQDFRKTSPYVLGDGLHVDVSTVLANGRTHKAKSLDEFASMVVSFGDVVETEFIASPIMVDTAKASPWDHSPFCQHVESLPHLDFVATAPNQLASYTSRDIHRVAQHVRVGNARLIIVTFEVDPDNEVEAEGGEIRPSIIQRVGA